MSWCAVFPGQGSQHVGMGQFLFENFKEAQWRFEEASDAIGVDFKKLCFSGSESDLQLTENTQPALLLVSIATFDSLRSTTDFKAIAAAGHSVGEYAALVSAGSMNFAEAIKAVRKRGEAMQKAVPVGKGGMCAVMGMTDLQVRELCKWVEKEGQIKPLEPANFNSPGQVVISGSAEAIKWMQENFKKEVLSDPPARAKFIPLKVSAPFHCSMMEPAEKVMRQELESLQFNESQWPVVQNFSAKESSATSDIREHLIKQITAPVLWTQCVERLKALGGTHYIEFGSGKVLSGLIKKIDSEGLQTFNLNSLEEFKDLERIYAAQR